MQLLNTALEILTIMQPVISIFGVATIVVGAMLMKKAPIPEMEISSMRVLKAGALITCLHPTVWIAAQIPGVLSEW